MKQVTVAEYNQARESQDPIFNKRFKFLKPIKTPKFYAAGWFPADLEVWAV